MSFATGVTEHVCWFCDVVVLAFVGAVLVLFVLFVWWCLSRFSAMSFAIGVTEHVCWFCGVVVLACVGSVLVSF